MDVKNKRSLPLKSKCDQLKKEKKSALPKKSKNIISDSDVNSSNTIDFIKKKNENNLVNKTNDIKPGSWENPIKKGLTNKDSNTSSNIRKRIRPIQAGVEFNGVFYPSRINDQTDLSMGNFDQVDLSKLDFSPQGRESQKIEFLDLDSLDSLDNLNDFKYKPNSFEDDFENDILSCSKAQTNKNTNSKEFTLNLELMISELNSYLTNNKVDASSLKKLKNVLNEYEPKIINDVKFDQLWLSSKKISATSVEFKTKLSDLVDRSIEFLKDKQWIKIPCFKNANVLTERNLKERLSLLESGAVDAFKDIKKYQSFDAFNNSTKSQFLKLNDLCMDWNYMQACSGSRTSVNLLVIALKNMYAEKNSKHLSDNEISYLTLLAESWDRLNWLRPLDTVKQKDNLGRQKDNFGKVNAALKIQEIDLLEIDSWCEKQALETYSSNIKKDNLGNLIIYTGSTLQVLDTIVDRNADSQAAYKRFFSLLTPLPLTGYIDADQIYRSLQKEFPWFEQANISIASAAAICKQTGLDYFRLPRPILIQGQPGIGKTRWARRVAEICNLKFNSLSLSGMSSSMSLLGAERGWSTGQPCFPARVMHTKNTANPLILIDEIDKSGESKQNGNPVDAILTMIEKESASRYPDNYLLGNLNLNSVCWIFAVNTLSGLPQTLLDRVDVVHPGKPEAKNFTNLLEGILYDLAQDYSIELSELPNIKDSYNRLEQVFYQGFSARKLQAAVEKEIKNKFWQPPGPKLVIS